MCHSCRWWREKEGNVQAVNGRLGQVLYGVVDNGGQVFTTMLTIEPGINACFDSLTHGVFLTYTEGVFSFDIRHAHT
jgi:hypothetical protein